MRGWIVILIFCLCMFLALGSVIAWPFYLQHQRHIRGVDAAELGAELAFSEDKYQAAMGHYTPDFTQLGKVMDRELPCPVEENGTKLVCSDYTYQLVAGNRLVALHKKSSAKFVFELDTGIVDCSQAPNKGENVYVCSSLE